MSVYFTSDLHLQHARIIELCDRPFKNVDHMDSAIIDGINSTLDPTQDDLYILGDICMGNMEKSLANLGRICARKVIMIPGNHDRWSLAYHTKGDHKTKRFDWALRYQTALSNVTAQAYAMRDRQPSVWRTSVEDRTFDISHYPTDGDSHGVDRYQDLRPSPSPGFLVHGHVHNAWRTNGRLFNVGVDVNNFKPVAGSVIVNWINDSIDAMPDTVFKERARRDTSLGVTHTLPVEPKVTK